MRGRACVLPQYTEQHSTRFVVSDNERILLQGPRPDVSYTATAHAAAALAYISRNSQRHMHLAGMGTLAPDWTIADHPTAAHGSGQDADISWNVLSMYPVCTGHVLTPQQPTMPASGKRSAIFIPSQNSSQPFLVSVHAAVEFPAAMSACHIMSQKSLATSCIFQKSV